MKCLMGFICYVFEGDFKGLHYMLMKNESIALLEHFVQNL